MKKDPELTKQKIRKAFLELYRDKRIESISIGELTEKAGVYRGTFYYYYKDIYDLLGQIEEELRADVMRILPELIGDILGGKAVEKTPIVERLFGKQEDLFRLFFIEKPNYRMLTALKEFAKATALKELGLGEEKLSIEIAYYAEYIASAQVGILTMWLQNRNAISTGQLADIALSAGLQGPMKCLKELAQNHR